MALTAEHYRLMLLIRRFEETVEELFSRGRIQGTTHPCIGQEATAVGVGAALEPGDAMTSTHRGHGHFLARGGDPNRMMAEFYGRATGYSGGRGGSQLMADYALGFIGGNGITGGSIPVATGVALAMKMRSQPTVAACFFGDGASNQGTFHESLNMAGLWKLPVLYVCENNQYAMSMPVRASLPIADIATRAAGYGMPGVIVDGNDVEAVQVATAAARERAVSGGGPTLIECKTYRLSGHSRGDQRKYRTRQEEAEARDRDPINRFRERLLERGLLGDAEDQALRARVEVTVQDAIRFAEASPVPAVETLEDGVFA